MRSQLLVSFVEVSFDRCVLDGAVHSLDLPIGPGMLGLCQPMVDIVLGAGVFEGVRPNEFAGVEGRLDVRRCRARIAWRCEVGPVVCEDGVDLVGNGVDQPTQEVTRGLASHFLMQFDEGELRGSVDCNEQIEFALRGSDFGDVDMRIADRVSLEFLLGGGVAFDLRQSGDPVPLQTPMK